MATIIQIKEALANNSNLNKRIALSGVLKLVEKIISTDPSILDSKLAESFFNKRRQKANQYATSNISSGGIVDVSLIPNLSNIALGFASDFVDRYIEASVAQGGPSNPWQDVEDSDVAASMIEPSIPDEAILGGAELSFNGLAGITRLESEKVIELGLWSHPFGGFSN